MKLFELFATLGLDTSAFEAEAAQAAQTTGGLTDALARLAPEAERAGQGMRAGIASAVPGIRAQAESIRAALAGAFDLSGVSVRWPSLGGLSAPAVDGSHAVGLDYVPYNGYVARLHEGERVLTRLENQQFSRGEIGGQAPDLSGLGPAIAASIQSALQGMAVTIDGQVAGQVLAGQISQNIADMAWAGRFAP